MMTHYGSKKNGARPLIRVAGMTLALSLVGLIVLTPAGTGCGGEASSSAGTRPIQTRRTLPGPPARTEVRRAAPRPRIITDTEQKWEVDQDRAPYQRFEYEATEATWLSLDVSPDGERIVFDVLGHLYEMPIGGGDARPLTRGRSWNMFPRYSPDGSKIAFTSDRGGSNDLWILNRQDRSFSNVSDMDGPVFQGTWSRDGRHLYGTALNMKVRFPVYQFNMFGAKQELIPAGDRAPVNHLLEHPDGDRIFLVHNDESLPASGPRIKTFDTRTGEMEVYIDRPGGAASPILSPDGRYLAYVHRDDKDTVLVLHDLQTREERVLSRNLDYGRLESTGFYGCYSNMSWHPDGSEIFVSFGGKIRAVSVADGQSRTIPFKAKVARKMDRTMRFKVELPEERARTRSHRWAQRIPEGVLFESLGDLYLRTADGLKNLTRSAVHETNPIYDTDSRTIYYAAWSDDELGAVYSLEWAAGKEPVKLTTVPSQYGSLALSRDGRSLACLRGGRDIVDGVKLEGQRRYELVLIGPDGTERNVTEVDWTGNRYGKRPPTILFAADDESLLFTEYVGDALTLKRIRLDGMDERTLYTFTNATRAVVSPDLNWIAFREYHRTYVTPYEFIGKPITVSAADGKGFTKRVDLVDGDFTEWTPDGKGLYWTRGRNYCVKSLAEILDGSDRVTTTDLSFEYVQDTPDTTIALTGVRVLTMNSDKQVIENATILVERNRIARVGTDVEIPAGAQVYDLTGRTVMPGIFDAHGHYGSPISTLNVIEQRLYGLHANLAYGVTTMFDVYGTTQKDYWVSDMLRAGKMIGPRIFSVGDPMFVTKYRTKMHRSIESLADAEEHGQFNKDHGATALKDYSDHRRKARQQLAAASRNLGLNLVTESFGNPQMNLTQIIDGFTGLEHTMGLTPLYDDVISLIAASKVGITPTLIVVYNGPAGERYFHMRERLWEDKKLQNFFRRDELMRLRRPTHYYDDDFYHMQMAAEMLKLHRRGVNMQMGAHGQMMGLGAHWEMEMFVHGGFTPLEAIQVATINGFYHHGLDHALGSIEEGKLADLVVLTANPLEDIRNTRSIEYVMKNGAIYSGWDAARVFPDPAPAKGMYFIR